MMTTFTIIAIIGGIITNKIKYTFAALTAAMITGNLDLIMVACIAVIINAIDLATKNTNTNNNTNEENEEKEAV